MYIIISQDANHHASQVEVRETSKPTTIIVQQIFY
jgi:hypothetical protein